MSVRPLIASTLLACAEIASASMVVRYRCRMVDDTERVVMRDLSQVFPQAVTACVVQQVPAAPEPAPAPAVKSSVPFTLIRAPAADADVPWTAPQPDLPEPPAYSELVVRAAARHGLDARLVSAVIHVESRFRADARSPKGALGLMQIMPATAARYGVAAPSLLFDPQVNIDVGTRYLRDLHRMFPGRTDLVIAAYNAGEGAVLRSEMRVPPFAETQDYVRKVTARLGR